MKLTNKRYKDVKDHMNSRKTDKKPRQLLNPHSYFQPTKSPEQKMSTRLRAYEVSLS